MDLLVSLVPITLLQLGAGSLCWEGILLMEPSSGSEFLTSWGMMDRHGPSIFYLSMLFVGTEFPVPVLTGVVVLGGITMVFLSTGIGPLAPFQFTTGGSFRTPAALHVTPMTISLCRTARTACKYLPLVATPSTVVCLTGRIMTGIIAGISRFVNNLYGEFTLVVSVSVGFLFFTSLVWVATNWSLFESLLATFLFEWSSAESLIVDWSVNLLNPLAFMSDYPKKFASHLQHLFSLLVYFLWWGDGWKCP